VHTKLVNLWPASRLNELSQAERGELMALLSGDKHAARKLKGSPILLATDSVRDPDWHCALPATGWPKNGAILLGLLTVHFFGPSVDYSRVSDGVGTMRAVIALTTAAAMMQAGIPTVPAFAQSTVTPVRLEVVTPDPAIVDIFNTFPMGGEPLSRRIADFIVSNPKLAPDLANYVVKTPALSKAQKVAAERGLAAALERLGINAADLPLAPGAVVGGQGFDPGWWFLAASALIAGLVVCAVECSRHGGEGAPSVPVSPH
jgi:hypothetical protein